MDIGNLILQAKGGIYVSLEPDGHPFINACFKWMINQIYIGNGWKSPNIHFQTGCLGVPGMYIYHEPPKTMKNKCVGHLKTRLFTTNTSKNVGLGRPWYIYLLYVLRS